MVTTIVTGHAKKADAPKQGTGLSKYLYSPNQPSS